MKFCIAPEIAVDTAPASVRWSGSHNPSRHRSGRKSDRAAAIIEKTAEIKARMEAQRPPM